MTNAPPVERIEKDPLGPVSIGYERAAELAKEVLASGKTIREVLALQPDLSEDLIAQTADPHLFWRAPCQD